MCLRVVGIDGVVELPTIMEVVVSTFVFLPDSEGARCHWKLCMYSPRWAPARVLIVLSYTRIVWLSFHE